MNIGAPYSAEYTYAKDYVVEVVALIYHNDPASFCEMLFLPLNSVPICDINVMYDQNYAVILWKHLLVFGQFEITGITPLVARKKGHFK